MAEGNITGIILDLSDPKQASKNYVLGLKDIATNSNTQQIILSGIGLNGIRQLGYKASIEALQQVSQNTNIPNVASPFTTSDNENLIGIKGVLGNLVFSNIYFKKGSYIDQFGVSYDYPDLRIDTVLIETYATKNVVRTQIQGKDYTVKEYINIDDKSITLRGLLLGTDMNNFPIDSFQRLNAIYDVPQSIEVDCWFLNQQGINELIIQNLKFEQVEGLQNGIMFNMQCLKDVPFNLL